MLQDYKSYSISSDRVSYKIIRGLWTGFRFESVRKVLLLAKIKGFRFESNLCLDSGADQKTFETKKIETRSWSEDSNELLEENRMFIAAALHSMPHHTCTGSCCMASENWERATHMGLFLWARAHLGKVQIGLVGSALLDAPGVSILGHTLNLISYDLKRINHEQFFVRDAF